VTGAYCSLTFSDGKNVIEIMNLGLWCTDKCLWCQKAKQFL